MDNAFLFSTIGGLLASVITKAISHKVKDLHPVTEVTLFGVVSFLGVALQWFASNGAGQLADWGIILPHFAEVAAAGTFLYQYAVRPVYGVLYAERQADAAAKKAAAAAAKVANKSNAIKPEAVSAPQEFEETPIAGVDDLTATPSFPTISAPDVMPGEASF